MKIKFLRVKNQKNFIFTFQPYRSLFPCPLTYYSSFECKSEVLWYLGGEEEEDDDETKCHQRVGEEEGDGVDNWNSAPAGEELQNRERKENGRRYYSKSL